VAAAGAALAALMASGVKIPLPRWLLVGFGVIAAASFLFLLLTGPVALWRSWRERRSRSIYGDEENPAIQLRMTDHGRPQRIAKWTDPIDWNVHRATSDITSQWSSIDSVPPYVEREIHQEVTHACSTERLVIIQGPSLAGKTRLAFEVVYHLYRRRRLIVPADATALRALCARRPRLRKAVVWLDNLQDYLLAGSLNAAALDALCPPGRTDVLILGTLLASARFKLTGSSIAEEVLERARVIRLEEWLTDAEQEQAERLRGDDWRIGPALESDKTHKARFAAYLANGPKALDRWQTARTAGRPGATAGAIISAAIDIRRAGHLSPIPASC
jgi:hypothetical protein